MFQSFLEYTKSNTVNKKLIAKYGEVKVYVVDGDAVRNSSKEAQEFGGSSTHAALPKVVPENEIWIEDDVSKEERRTLIASSLYQIANTTKGMSYRKAYDLAVKKEKDYRDSVSLSKKHPLETNKPADKSIYLKKYGDMKGDISVWLVSGEKVRNKYKVDWIEGGNPAVYDFNPNDEIWIEFGPNTDSEAPYILLHEYVEMIIMKFRKLDYNHAHEIAAKAEWKMREKGGYAKEMALALDKTKAIELAKDC